MKEFFSSDLLTDMTKVWGETVTGKVKIPYAPVSEVSLTKDDCLPDQSLDFLR